MARRRMIDPSIWFDSGFMKMSVYARQLFIGMISYADDEGRGEADPQVLKAKIFPRDEMLSETMERYKAEVAKRTSTVFYWVDDDEYYQLKKWGEYQTINRPYPSHLPAPPSDLSDSRSDSLIHSVNGSVNDSRQDREQITPNIEQEEEKIEQDTKNVRARENSVDESWNPEECPPPGTQSLYQPIPVPTPTTPLPRDESEEIAYDYYRRWTKETARPMSPRGHDFPAARELLASLGGRMTPEIREGIGKAIDRYFCNWQDYWFARVGKKPPYQPQLSFAGFCRHYPELALDSKSGAKKDWRMNPEIVAMLAKEDSHGA